MNMNDEDEKKHKISQAEEDGRTGEGDQGGESGWGGAAGEIAFHFRDAMSIEPRDDVLPPTEIKRLLAVQKDLHKKRVDKQKLARREREALKTGQVKLASGQHGYAAGYGRSSPYKKHPISNKAQFSGIDRQVVGIPGENIAETNEAPRNDLENRYQLRYQNVPTFNPRPRPR